MAYKVYTKTLSSSERERRGQRRERSRDKRIAYGMSLMIFHLESCLRSAAVANPDYERLLGADLAETLNLFSDYLDSLVEQDARSHTQSAAAFLVSIHFWPPDTDADALLMPKLPHGGR